MLAERTIHKLFPTFQSDRDEYMKALLLFSYLFCVVSASTIGRTAADTLFLSRFDNSALSFMYLPQAVAMIMMGVIFQRYSPQIRLERLITTLIPVIALLVLLSRIGVGLDVRWVFPTMYIGYDVFNFLMIVCFWQFATSVMDQRKAKRMIGIVGSGGIAGGIVSGFGLKALVPLLGTANLIYVYAGFQLAGLAVVLLILSKFPLQAEARPQKSQPHTKQSLEKKAGLFKHVPHLKYVAVLAAALVFSLTLIDYQFKVIIRGSLQNEALAEFMGSFYGFSGIIALLVQLLVSGWVIRRFGVMVALLVFPIVLFAGSLGILMVPVLAMAVMVKGSDKVIGDTIYSSVSQLIMFPIPPEWRGKAKSFLDGIVRNGAKGLAAVCLLVSSQLLAPEQLSYLILALLAIGIIAAIKLKKAYLQTLVSTLQTGNYDLQRAELNIMDPASLRLLTDALASSDKQQALYAFRILRGLEAFDFDPYIKPLLQHRDPIVCMEALAFVEQTVPAGLEKTVQAFLASDHTQLKAKAILALAAYAKEEYLDELSVLLDEQEAEIQTAAIAALIKHYGIEGMFRSVAKLKQLIESDQENHRMAVASLFGQIGVQSFYKPLAALLQDSSSQVRIRALQSAAILGVPALIPAIMPSLQSFETRRHAIDALASYQEADLVPLFMDALNGTGSSLHVPAVFEKIGTQHSFDLLLSGYRQAAFDMRDKILESLTRMHKKSFAVPQKEIESLIAGEIQLFHQFTEHGAPLAGMPHCTELVLVVEQLRSAASRRVFQLLALLYDPLTMQAVFKNWSEGDARQQANAAEIIDQTVQGSLRMPLAALMSAPRNMTASASRQADTEAHFHWFREQGDEWLKEVACFATLPSRDLAATDSRTAEQLHRVNLLHHVPVFQGLTSKQLSGIATRLEQLTVSSGQLIIQEGEPGDCMYVLVTGRAGVYRNEQKLGDLHPEDCFGEMALFSQGLRAATIRAETDLVLWRLDSSTFYDILFNHTSIAVEMVKLLSRRLRSVLEQGGVERQPEVSGLSEIASASVGIDRQTSLDPGMDLSRHEVILRRILTLQKIDLFAHLTQDDFIWLAQSMEEVEYSPGQRICRAGEFGDTMYAIVSGHVRVHRGEKTIAELKEGEYFGEMAVIDSGPRSADCTAVHDVIVLELHRDLVTAFYEQNKNVLKSILRVLADRLKGVS
ncbi:Npt1/Npt2 family nucleotide transporter [Paenibacillus puerhi]|uniref:Npt1/Npt2 family nucleotide transporter n=1 Tax=Paenibacillus puerhi TaxID=2692622 RepID=UPI00135BFD98|nr:Npt1/Npt2 family nucleotide transporter [Paenibacillus puerhi]